jgi:proline iminopeptidase
MALGLARIEAHYFVNDMFVGDDQLIANMDRIRHLPGQIIQGRYDIVCPCSAADELSRAWPNADYIVVPDAGHSAMEPGIRAALLAATDKFRKLT